MRAMFKSRFGGLGTGLTHRALLFFLAFGFVCTARAGSMPNQPQTRNNRRQRPARVTTRSHRYCSARRPSGPDGEDKARSPRSRPARSSCSSRAYDLTAKPDDKPEDVAWQADTGRPGCNCPPG